MRQKCSCAVTPVSEDALVLSSDVVRGRLGAGHLTRALCASKASGPEVGVSSGRPGFVTLERPLESALREEREKLRERQRLFLLSLRDKTPPTLSLLDGARARPKLASWVRTVDLDKVTTSSGSALFLVLGPHGGCCCAVCTRPVASSTAMRQNGMVKRSCWGKCHQGASLGKRRGATLEAVRQKLSISSSHFSSAQNRTSLSSEPAFSRRSCLAARSDSVGGGDL